jgi:hypothetical protein
MARHERPHSTRVRAAIGALIAGGMLFAGPAGIAFAAPGGSQGNNGNHGQGNNGNGNGNNGNGGGTGNGGNPGGPGDPGSGPGSDGGAVTPAQALSDGGSCPPGIYLPRSCSPSASGVCCTGTHR